jgi:hypothetical protein
VELLTLPVRQLSSFGSSGAELLRAALVQEAQDGFARRRRPRGPWWCKCRARPLPEEVS